jgi:hypothetical protein
MADALNDDLVAFNTELKSVISRAYPVMSREISPQRFRSADLRPMLKPFE